MNKERKSESTRVGRTFNKLDIYQRLNFVLFIVNYFMNKIRQEWSMIKSLETGIPSVRQGTKYPRCGFFPN